MAAAAINKRKLHTVANALLYERAHRIRGMDADELFAELDVAAQFRAACLDEAWDGKVIYADMVRAVTVWTNDSELDGDVIPRVIADLKKQRGVRYATSKIGGKAVKAFSGVRLRSLEVEAA